MEIAMTKNVNSTPANPSRKLTPVLENPLAVTLKDLILEPGCQSPVGALAHRT
jgi:hypothetical protein